MITSFNDAVELAVTQALEEDLAQAGDVTSCALFSERDESSAVIRSKSEGILSGCALIASIFSHCDKRVTVAVDAEDGSVLRKGTVIARLEGPVRGILSGERLCLNFLQRLSGVATVTSTYARAIAHTNARLLDTRKTTPGLRWFEKAAVRHGGGCNHRFGLFDMILIKDTHVKRSGGVTAALEKAFRYRNTTDTTIAIEIEVQSPEEFADALAMNPERIMLDNMSMGAMRECVARRDTAGSQCELEASGAITLQTIAAVAETGVDYISAGALTHSAPSLDIHLVIQ